jgi:hypothetical protein
VGICVLISGLLIATDWPFTITHVMRHPQLNHSLIEAIPADALRAGDRRVPSQAPDAAVGVEQHVADVGGRVAEMRRVGRVKRIEAELQPSLIRSVTPKSRKMEASRLTVPGPHMVLN